MTNSDPQPLDGQHEADEIESALDYFNRHLGLYGYDATASYAADGWTFTQHFTSSRNTRVALVTYPDVESFVDATSTLILDVVATPEEGAIAA